MKVSCKQISNNMYLSEEGFGQFNFDIVCDLLKHVDIWLSDALGRPPFSSGTVAVVHGDENPMCCKHESIHVILLTAEDDYWCQWVYQFAHEYCHHLIDGPLDGELHGLKWFEETICELSSLFCLHRMADYCNSHANPCLDLYHPLVQNYLEYLLRGEEDGVPLHLYMQRNLHLLTQPVYHRDIYRDIARRILSLFVDCPSLWRIIFHFGNMNEWKQLSLLFDHLREEADTTYEDSLHRLRLLLLGA